MKRARQTYELMFTPATQQNMLKSKAKVTPELTEWDYGDYEGLTTREIRELREKRGLNGQDWDHFRDGCEGGEYVTYPTKKGPPMIKATTRSPEQVAHRLDSIVERIQEIHRPNMHGENACDVLLVSNSK